MKKVKEKKNDINLILLLFPVLIILGKVIRWTILKSVLVDMSIGNSMINIILHSTRGFTSFAETGVSDAAGNPKFIGLRNCYVCISSATVVVGYYNRIVSCRDIYLRVCGFAS